MAAGTPTSPPRLSPVSLSCHLCFTPTGLLDLQGCKTLCQYDTQTTHGPCMPVLFCIRITGSRSSLLIECWTMLGAAFNPKGCFTDHDTALGNTHIICSHCCFYAAGETLKNHFTVILDVWTVNLCLAGSLLAGHEHRRLEPRSCLLHLTNTKPSLPRPTQEENDMTSQPGLLCGLQLVGLGLRLLHQLGGGLHL